MCFFTTAFLVESKKPWHTKIPDTMQLMQFLQVYSSTGPYGLQEWLQTGVDLKLARGYEQLIQHSLKSAQGHERDEYEDMLHIVKSHVQKLS